MSEKYIEGTLVELPPKPDFGLGKVLKISGDKIYVFFRNQPNRDALISSRKTPGCAGGLPEFDLSGNKLCPRIMVLGF